MKKQRKVRITSNHHDPYKLGYTLATIIITKRCNFVKRSKTLKIILVQIIFCNLKI